MTYIGIDPGKNGAFAFINSIGVSAFVFEEKNFIERIKRVASADDVFACLEHVHAMPGQGVTGMFNFGKNFGFIQGVLSALCVPYELVTPQKWKKEFSITANKNTAILVCKRLFPDVPLIPTERSRKEHDGIAEALLMAEYARRNSGRC